MLLKHWSFMSSCRHGVGSEHAQALRPFPRPRGEVPKATPLARRAEMRSIIIFFNRVGAVCICAPQGGVVGRWSGDRIRRVCGAEQMDQRGDERGAGQLAVCIASREWCGKVPARARGHRRDQRWGRMAQA